MHCGSDWTTTKADLKGNHGEARGGQRLARSGTHRRPNGSSRPKLDDAGIIDFAFTAATNTVPLCRMPQIACPPGRVAWLCALTRGLDPLDQVHMHQRDGLVHVHAAQLDLTKPLEVNDKWRRHALRAVSLRRFVHHEREAVAVFVSLAAAAALSDAADDWIEATSCHRT